MSRLDWLTARPVAHRGLHDAAAGIIENTRSAVRGAVEAGFAFEVDLQISADGEAMVHHDDDLDRLTEGHGPLAAMTARQLKEVPFKATADRMMTLTELCKLVDGRVTMVLELKSHDDDDRRLVARTAQVLSRYRGPVAVMSFDPVLVRACSDVAPALTRGLVAENRTDEGSPLRALLGARPQFVAYSVRDLPAFLPLAARYLLRLPLLTWTVRTAEDRLRAARWADQMIFEGFRP